MARSRSSTDAYVRARRHLSRKDPVLRKVITRVGPCTLEPGGAVKSGPLTGQRGFTHDHCSAFFPLAVVSPPIRGLDLEYPEVTAAQRKLLDEARAKLAEE